VKATAPVAADSAEATLAAVDEAVTSPELRALIERMPLWRRPGYLIRRLHQLHSALFAAECAEFDITPVQYGLLTTLGRMPDADQNSLAQEVGLDRTNVADVLIRLANRGLIRRRRAKQDHRMMVSRLTPAGEKLTAAMSEAMTRAQHRLLAPLEANECEVFIATLLRLVDGNNENGRTILGPAIKEAAE
jgi:DNA-binding MarR family transcriptional regulator